MSSLSSTSHTVTEESIHFQTITLESRHQRECRRRKWKSPPTRTLRRPICSITIPSNTFSMNLSLRFTIFHEFSWTIFVFSLEFWMFVICFFWLNGLIRNWLGFDCFFLFWLQIVTSKGYPEDVRMSNIRLLIGAIIIVIAIFAQFYNKKFPENQNFLIGCIVLYPFTFAWFLNCYFSFLEWGEIDFFFFLCWLALLDWSGIF